MQLLLRVLREGGFAQSSLFCLASVSIKVDEAGLWEAADMLNLPLRLFTPEELHGLPVSEPSPKARAVLGLDGVCEPAALAAVLNNTTNPGITAACGLTKYDGKLRHFLLVPKTKGHGVTVALARLPLTPYPTPGASSKTPLA